MKLERDDALKTRLIQALTEKYSGSREEIHVSDLVYCLREAYFRKTEPKPPSEMELMFYVDGARRHHVIEVLSGQESEVEIVWEGVKGTVDMLEHAPVEIKTTRANKSLPLHYFRQLGYYCAMLNTSTGYLLIQRLNNRENPWECWKVTFSHDDLEQFKNEIIEKRDLLKKALEGNPEILPKTDLTNENGQPWKCRHCKYKESCAQLDEQEAGQA